MGQKGGLAVALEKGRLVQWCPVLFLWGTRLWVPKQEGSPHILWAERVRAGSNPDSSPVGSYCVIPGQSLKLSVHWSLHI
jgi:hypothetical protein